MEENKIAEIKNPELVEAMKQVKVSQDPGIHNNFINLMINASYYVPVTIDPPPRANGNIIPGSDINYCALRSPQGEDFILVFTSLETLNKWVGTSGQKPYNIIRHFQDVKNIVLENDHLAGYIIDPQGQDVVIRRDFLTDIAKKIRRMDVKTENITHSDVEVSVPNEGLVPQNLHDSLVTYMQSQPNISKAYFMQTVREGSEPTILIIVDFEGDLQGVLNGIASVSQEALGPGKGIALMPYKDKIAQEYVVGIEPFYQK